MYIKQASVQFSWIVVLLSLYYSCKIGCVYYARFPKSGHIAIMDTILTLPQANIYEYLLHAAVMLSRVRGQRS